MTGAIDPSFINPVYSGASLADDLTSTNNNLFGSGADPTTANPAQSQAIIDAVNQAVNGGSATGTAVSALTSNLSQIPAQNVQPSMSNSTTVTVDAAGPGASSTPNSTAQAYLSWLHPLGASANYLVVAVHVAPMTSGVPPTVTLSNTPMAHLAASAVGPTGGLVNLYGLRNPATGSQLVQVTVPASSPATAVIAGESISYNGVYSVSAATTLNNNRGSNPSMSVGSITGQCVAQAFAAYNINAQSVAMSSYNQTQEGNTGNVVNSTTGFDYSLLMGSAPGAGSVSFSATVATANSFTWWGGISVNLLPSPVNEVGSGMRIYANNGTNLPAQTTMGLFASGAPLANVQYMTGDIILIPGFVPGIQVSYAGWYMCTVSLRQNSGTGGVGVGLFQNGALFEQGETKFNTTAGPAVVKSAFLVYCNSGDTLQPAYSATTSTAAGTESTGTQSYWSCALVNRSYL